MQPLRRRAARRPNNRAKIAVRQDAVNDAALGNRIGASSAHSAASAAQNASKPGQPSAPSGAAAAPTVKANAATAAPIAKFAKANAAVKGGLKGGLNVEPSAGPKGGVTA